MKKYSLLLIAMSLGVLSADMYAYDWSANTGDGSLENPYRIINAEQLVSIGSDPNLLDKCFVLDNDIDLSGYVFSKAVIAPDKQLETGLFEIQPFAGYFNGQGHTINNLYIRATDSKYLGLFGAVETWGQIEKLNVVNSLIDSGTRKFGFHGLIAGMNYGLINDCTVTGELRGNPDNGGIAGHNIGGRIDNCVSNCIVYGSTSGGLVGHNEDGHISNSHSNGQVTGGHSHVGGLVGYSKNGSISNCSNAANVVSSHDSVGGLVGFNYLSTITTSFSTGSVQGRDFVGGFVGWNSSGKIQDCYSSGDVSGRTEIGGLVGSNGGATVINCYSCGRVTGEDLLGGLIGEGDGVINSFWDINMSRTGYSAGGRGRSSISMKQDSNYIAWNKDGHVVWKQDNGNDYPRLAWENTPGQELQVFSFAKYVPGLGTAEDPYRITTPLSLFMIGLFPEKWGGSRHFVLLNDIDLSELTGMDFNRIGVNHKAPFRSIFNGNGHVIRNYTYISSGDERYVGLFGYVKYGTIHDLHLENIHVESTGSYVGGLIGRLNERYVLRCSSSGTVKGRERVGGLIGEILGGKAQYSCSEGTVEGTHHDSELIGGLVGSLLVSSNIYDCYSHSSVKGYAKVGGLVGCFGNTNINDFLHLSRCFSTGHVEGSEDVGGLAGLKLGEASADGFWNIDSSGQTHSAAGTGSNTIEMKNISIYLDAGWDFAGESTNGIKEIWRLCEEGAEYPKLVPILNQNGDFSCPGGTGVEDLYALAECWLSNYRQFGIYNRACDVEYDDYIDFNDFVSLASGWKCD